MDEATTRKTLIDPALRLAGWDTENPSQVITELALKLDPTSVAETPETDGAYRKIEFTDYALVSGGVPLAVVEAKRTSKDPEIGKQQALEYAERLKRASGGDLPFIFYTNGYKTHFWDSESYPPAEVYGFPTLDDISWLAERRRQQRPLSIEMIDTAIAGRDYQIAAVRTILEEIEARRRTFLLVMATGTGKTRTATALIDVLRRAKWARRVLFLVDRIALRDQALEAFAEFIPSEPTWPQKSGNDIEREFSRSRRLYVATYPTMLNLIQNAPTPRSYISPFFFDLVIADESHRGIYDVYKQVLDYFHALRLGLTATPRDHIEHHTFRLFDCSANRPTFAYSYEEAIQHQPPYLCEFEVLDVRSKYQIEGIHGGTLPESARNQLALNGIEPDDVDFEGTDLEKRVTNAGTNALVVQEFMEESIKDADGVLPGKSIIFAMSMKHARRLEEIFNRLYPEYKGRLARVLVSDDPRVYGKGGLLDEFKNRDMPRVALSVDMLDTGVDIREVVNLVLAKPVWSYTKFWQMIGRGTRVLKEDPGQRRPWCLEKDRFLIIDCWRNFEFFQMHPRGKEPGAQVALPVRLFRARLDKLEAAAQANESAIVERVKGQLQEDLAALPENNVVVLQSLADLVVVRNEQFWPALKPADVDFLRVTIAPIMRARSSADFKAMLFERDVVLAQTALLRANADAFTAARESLRVQLEELPLAVNVVARERDLIQKALQESFWLAPSDESLDELTAKLGPLMRFRQRRPEPIMSMDLLDLTVVKESIEFGPAHERLTTKAYREEVESFVRGLVATTPALQKLKQGEKIDAAELRDLAARFANDRPWVTEDLLRRIYDNRAATFEQFLKHILGLEQLASWTETVTRAFDEYISEHTTLTALQIRFLQTLRTFILQTGRVEKKNLVEAPFTQLHPQGVRGVFSPQEIEDVLTLGQRLVA